MNFENKIIFLTGAGSGIGMETALLFLSKGCTVIGADLKKDSLDKLETNSTHLPGKLFPLQLDVASSNAGKSAYTTIESFAKLDVLINCAGICTGTSIDETTEAEWDLFYDVNVKGPFFLTRTLIPLLLKSTQPCIVNVSSMAGFTGGIKSNVAYSSSKAAVTCMTKNLAKIYANCGIRVNEVSPGTADTPMTQEWLGKDELANFSKTVPLGRLTAATDIANAICFLASSEASFITGQSLQVNGGMYIP